MKKESQATQTTENIHTELPRSLVEEASGTFSHPEPGNAQPDPLIKVEKRSKSNDYSIKGNFAFHVHNYVSEYNKFADQKAAFIFAINAALLGYLFQHQAHKMWLKKIHSWDINDALCFLSMFFLALGLISTCAVIIPSLRKTHKGIVFFRNVSEYDSASAYASEISDSIPERLFQEIAKHTFDLSRICSSKYWKLVIGSWSTSLGVILTVIVLLLVL